jgi:putative membrane protein
MVRFLLRAAVAAIGLWVASVWVSGLTLDTPGTLLLAGLLLGIVNAIVRPIAILLTFPVTIVTLGLFLLVINAAMLGLVAWMLPGMHVAGFWAAFAASFIVSVVSFIGSRLIGPSARVEVIVRRR